MKLNPKQLHQTYNIYEDMPHFHVVQSYNKHIERWVFTGYQCKACGSQFKNEPAMRGHTESCLYLNGLRRKHVRGRSKIDNDEPVKVLDQHRNEWKPLKINQNLPDK